MPLQSVCWLLSLCQCVASVVSVEVIELILVPCGVVESCRLPLVVIPPQVPEVGQRPCSVRQSLLCCLYCPPRLSLVLSLVRPHRSQLVAPQL